MESKFSDNAVWNVEYAYAMPGEWETTEESITAIAPTVKLAAKNAQERLEIMAKKNNWMAYTIFSISVADRWEAPQ